MGKVALRYNPRPSFLTRMNPTFKLVYLLILSILISKSTMYELYGYSILVIILGLIGKISLIKECIKMPMMTFLGIFIGLTEFISSHSISMAVHEGVEFLTILMLAILFMETTDITELSASLGHYLSPIMKKRAWMLSSYIMVTIALLPMIFTCSRTMLDARRSRAGSFLSHPVKNISEYTTSLMLMLFNKARCFEDALYSRAFCPTADRCSDNASYRDIITLICITLVASTIFLLKKNC